MDSPALVVGVLTHAEVGVGDVVGGVGGELGGVGVAVAEVASAELTSTMFHPITLLHLGGRISVHAVTPLAATRRTGARTRRAHYRAIIVGM